ncbi:MAG: DUF1694 domain-containing protein [Fusobacteriaceae bacterium]
MNKDIIIAQEKTRSQFFKTQTEREEYLHEFKENIIISINKSDVEVGIIYPEIIEAMHEPDAILLKMRRDISLKYLKPYIDVAEKIGLRYMLIDALTFIGDVGIVVVSKDAMNNENINLLIDTIEEKFINAGLEGYYSKFIGKKICVKHYKKIEEKLPLYKGSFMKFNFFDKILGHICPICEEERGNK